MVSGKAREAKLRALLGEDAEGSPTRQMAERMLHYLSGVVKQARY